MTQVTVPISQNDMDALLDMFCENGYMIASQMKSFCNENKHPLVDCSLPLMNYYKLTIVISNNDITSQE